MSLAILLLYLALTYLQPVEFFPQLGQYSLGLIMLVLMGLACAASTILHPCALVRSRQTYLLLGFAFAVALSRLGQGWFGAAAVGLIEFGTNLLIFACVVLAARSLSRIRIIAVALILLTGVLVLEGIASYHLGWKPEKFITSYAQMLEEGTDLQTVPFRIQALGILNNPNNLGQVIVMAIPLVGLAWRPKRRLWNLLFVLAPMALLIYGVYLTGSRGGTVGLIVLSLLAFRDRLGLTRATVICLIVALVLMGLKFGAGREMGDAQEGSAHGRIVAWSAGLAMLKSSPIWGVGYDRFAKDNENNRLTAHNSWVLCFAELGLFGYFFWLALLFITYLQLGALAKAALEDPADPRLARYAKALKLSFFGFLTDCLFASRTYVLFLYVLIGLGAALENVASGSEKPISLPRLASWAPRVAALEVASIVLIYVIVRTNF